MASDGTLRSKTKTDSILKAHDLPATLAEGSAPLVSSSSKDRRTQPSALVSTAAQPQKCPRIVDASPSFDFDELVDWQVPSTIPGGDESDGVELQHRAPRAPVPGQRVGRYLAEEILGQGGMGMVLRARDDLLQREVAIKVILPAYLATDPTAGLRFLREAEIVARLDHPNIIRVLDAGLDAGVAYLAFEYVHGTTFSGLRDGRLAHPSDAVDVLIPVLSAVARAHQLGVVHGDLKPTNLLLGQDHAGRPHPWVLDFGVSFFSDVDANMDPTRKRVSGTPGYLAPEWLDGKGVDGRADCFSLGCVLYELLAGKGPFAGISRLSQAVAAAERRDYPPLADVSTASPLLADVVQRALDPNPATRVPSAREMARALLPFASHELRAYYLPEFAAEGGCP